MKILVAGASGLIGQALVRHLAAKEHQVVKLSRQPGEKTIVWNPAKGELDAQQLEGFDAIINLAGENIADGRWTQQKKQAILETRIQSTALLCKTLLQLTLAPKLLINASAVGYYGDQKEVIVDEASPAGKDFLADVCRQWEAAAAPAKTKGVRVVLLRLGVVLAKEGGALANMLTPFKLGIGGRLGSGNQYMSWISLNEVVRIIDFILSDEHLEGPVNAVAPCPATNAEFTKALGKALRRPTWLPMPAFAVRLLFGELADSLLLASTRVHPNKLQQAGYIYSDPSLESTLRSILRDSKA